MTGLKSVSFVDSELQLRMICLIGIFYCVFLAYAEAAPPSWIKPCSRSDPNFNECAVENSKFAISQILNGDRKYGIPSFNPFRITQVDLFGQENFSLKLRNLKVTGLDKLEARAIEVDFNTKKVKVRTYVPRIEISADYEIDGRILILPLTGSGPCELSLVDGTYEYNFTYELEKRNGVDYAKIIDALSTFDYDIKKGVFKLDNLFNGDPLLGAETNKLLNESWSELNEDLKPSISQTLLSIYAEMAKKIYARVPFDDLVLP